MKMNVIATVIKRLEYKGEFFEVDDYVRVLLKKKQGFNYPCEYIGFIKDITKNCVTLYYSSYPEPVVIEINDIDKIRIAKKHENFYDNFDWDSEVKDD